MSLARTSPGAEVFRYTVLGFSTCIFRGMRFKFRIRSVVSSMAPGMGENSCSTPSTRTAVIAAPSIEESSTRRRALPTVVAKPRSNGCAEKRPNCSVRTTSPTLIRFGFWNPFHSIFMRPPFLLRVRLDDELLLDGEVHFLALRQRQHLPLHGRGVELEPAGHAASLHRFHRRLHQRV